MRPTNVMLSLAIGLASFSFVGGCSDGDSSAYVFVVDYSGSTAPSRRQELGALLAELENAPPETHVTVLRMGLTTDEVYSGQMSNGVDSLVETLVQDSLESDKRPGTDFAAMAASLAAYSARFEGIRYRVRIFTDGANDFAGVPENARALKQSAQELCLDERMSSLVFQGVKAGFREPLRTAYSAAGARLQFRSATEVPYE